MKHFLFSLILLLNAITIFSQDMPVRKIRVYLPTFKTYTINSIYTGKTAKINFSSNPEMKMYRTMISTGYKKNKLNFAGHYCFVEWGCGSPCRASAIVDLRNGKIYDAPTSSIGCGFRKNSLMVIVNPPPKDNLLDDYMMATTPQVWILNEQTKTFIQKKVRFSPSPHFGPRDDG